MDSDERDIVDYLSTCHGQFVSPKEICRRACNKKRYREDPDWAMPILPRMADQGFIERDGMGHYKLAEEKKKDRKKWVAPDIQKILEESGKDFSESIQMPPDGDPALIPPPAPPEGSKH